MTNSDTSIPPSEFGATPAADLWIAEVRVFNFRNLVAVAVPLQRTATFLVGENNAGKTSFLLAIAAVCGVYRATHDDLHRTDETIESEACVDLILRSTEEEFSEDVQSRLIGNSSDGPKPGEWVAIRTRLVENKESPLLSLKRCYLRWDPTEHDWLETPVRPQRQALELLAARLVDASRDLSVDVFRHESDWGRVLSNLEMSSEDREDFEARLVTLSGELREASPILRYLSEELQKVKETHWSVGEVELHPIPARLEDLARSVDILVGAGEGAIPLPIRLQGLGSRSLAALRVFNALLRLRVGVDQGVRPHVISLLEEPEAHLHPQAQSAVHQFIHELPSQVVVTTHSSILLGQTDMQAIRIFRTSEEGTQVESITEKTAKKVAVFRRYISRPLGELFFARLVILVDGTAERITLPVLLRPLLGREIAGLGVTILDMEGMTDEWLQKVLDALDELGGVPWLVFVDNDSAGLKSVEGCIGSDGVNLTRDHPQVVLSGSKQLEQLLIDAEYTEEIEVVANRYGYQLPPYDSTQEDKYLNFLKRNKGWSGELIAREAVQNRREAHPTIIDLARRVQEALSLKTADIDEQSLNEEVW